MMDQTELIVTSEAYPLGGIDFVFWRIVGRDRMKVDGEIDRLRSVSNAAIFTESKPIPAGPCTGWYRSIGVTK